MPQPPAPRKLLAHRAGAPPVPRVALKVAYDGSAFVGSQRQPGLRTVESELVEGLAAIGAIADTRSETLRDIRFQCASRTDGGVSATGNVFAFDTDFPVERLPAAVAANVKDMWPWAASPAPDRFRARRHVVGRVYRYRLLREGRDPKAVARALALFEGVHDFTNFSRLEKGREPVRHLEVARIEDADDTFLTLRFAASGFLWNQVRRIVSATCGVADGLVAPHVVRDALDTGIGPDLGLAHAEPLILLDVTYEHVTFQPDPKAARRAVEDVTARAVQLQRSTAFLSDVAETVRRRSVPVEPRRRGEPHPLSRHPPV